MKTTHLILLMLLVINAGCIKLNNRKDTPRCIRQKTREFSRDVDCEDSAVRSYMFQGEVVYAFETGSCWVDGATEIVSSDCNALGYLGGIDGETEINGSRFYENAQFIEIIWER